jgi:hypothetical protein
VPPAVPSTSALSPARRPGATGRAGVTTQVVRGAASLTGTLSLALDRSAGDPVGTPKSKPGLLLSARPDPPKLVDYHEDWSRVRSVRTAGPDVPYDVPSRPVMVPCCSRLRYNAVCRST